jgi:hypothetical protein
MKKERPAQGTEPALPSKFGGPTRVRAKAALKIVRNPLKDPTGSARRKIAGRSLLNNQDIILFQSAEVCGPFFSSAKLRLHPITGTIILALFDTYKDFKSHLICGFFG